MPNQDNYSEKLNILSEEEKNIAIQILQELSESGTSKLLDDLKYGDFNEVPVDIETFLTDPQYLGNAWTDAQGNLKLYPFWLEVLKELFPDNLSCSVNNFIESGARGLGKSEIAVTIMLYLMYRIICMKNPLEYYGLKPTEKICFPFMNIDMKATKGIAISKFQNTVQMSPWFMKRGKMTQFENNPYWIPPEPIEVIIGSQPSHIIGRPVFCLTGDTEIRTENGFEKLEQLVNKPIKVYSLDNNNNIILSDICTVKPTTISNEQYIIELENNSIIKCTPNHRLMLIDGTYKEAKDLTENDELMDILFTDTKSFGYVSTKRKN